MAPRPTVHVEESLTYYWDAIGLVWVAGTQPGGGSGGGGDASAANQLLGNASLSAIDGKLPALVGGTVPVSLATAPTTPVTGTFFQATQPVSGTVTANAGTGTLAVSLATLPALVAGSAAIGKLAANSGIDIGDVDVTSLPAITGTVTANAGTNLNTSALALETTLGGVKTAVELLDNAISGAGFNVTQLAGVAPSLNTGVRDAGTQRVTIATNDTVPVTGTFWQATQPVSGTVTVTQATLTKGTQGATGVTTQDLHNAGRNQTNYFHALGIAATNTDTLQSLTGYKAGAAVTATTQPAVVTTGKTYRIKTIIISYQSLATAGGASIRIRANLSGLVAITSPLVACWTVGSAAAVAGLVTTEAIPVPDGMEFAAGTGIGISVLGLSTVGAALAAGFVTVTIEGFEY